MANLSYVQADIDGAAITMAAAATGGDKVAPNPRGAVLITNGGASPITATVVVPGNTQFGQAQPDVAISVPAGATRVFGPFPQELADPIDGLVSLTYSGVTSVTVAAIQI